jgi:beta-lactam-binding protein with PASTA domain
MANVAEGVGTVSGKGLDGEPSYPTESGDESGLPPPVGLAAAALDAIVTWLAPSRQSRVVKVPEFRGQHVSETFLPALQAGVKTRIVRVTEHPAPTDGYVVAQDPLPGTRAKRDSTVFLIVRHPEDPRG